MSFASKKKQGALIVAISTTIFYVALFTPQIAIASEELFTPITSEQKRLAPIVVIGEDLSAPGTGITLDQGLIQKLPLRNSNINDVLTILPGVQFSESANLSRLGGEILPSAVSISGGKTFENNFILDGAGNNSMLDPDSATDPLTNNDLPGHAQELFLDASLVDRVTVYDSNVPARYSRFKGGVVDAETINPLPWFSGKLLYRTTRDEWTSFHIDPGKKEDFLNSNSHRQQPKFEKHHAGIDLHIPLSSRLSTVSSYRLLHSRIPLLQLGETRAQERRQENFLVKTIFPITENTGIDLLWTYTPYHGRYFKTDFRNSDFTLEGGGHLFSATGYTRLPLAILELKGAYQVSENSRKAPKHMTQIQNPDKSWDKEGFLGDIEKTQQSIQLGANLAFLPLITGKIGHRINAGFETQHIEGNTERRDTSYLYTYQLKTIPKRTVYEKGDAKAIMRQYGLYLDDILTWDRLEIRPGLRLDYDDFTHNLNLAPRLAAALDIFGNQQTMLTAGLNRYFANTLLTYKMREGLVPTYQERWSGTDWTFFSRAITATRYSELSTPYADEYVIGLEQRLLSGMAAVKYIQRKGRDEFAKTFGETEEDGFRYSTLNNNGHSRHQSYRMSWERQWKNHFVNINGTYQETTASNESYDELLNEEDLDKRVWHDGESLNKTELPRKDYNRPWIVNFVYVGKFPYGFTFSSLVKYRNGYRLLKDTKEKIELPDGEILPIYDEVKKGGSTAVSCRIDWEKRLYRSQRLLLSLEVENLLNKKTSSGNTDDYEIGRQIWAGMEYRF